MSRRFVLLLGAALWTFSSVASAQVSSATDGGAADEIAALQKQIAKDFEALSGGDCAIACQALASMQRSTDRLCALDPGPPCSEARAKLADAESRVRAACPDCAVAVDKKPEVQAAPGATPVAADAPAPPAEAPGSGGCAGCAVGGESPGALGWLAAAAAIAAWMRRRRRGCGGQRPDARSRARW